MTAAVEISRAIRGVIENHGGDIPSLPDKELEEMAAMTTAFAMDLQAEVNRRPHLTKLKGFG